MSAEVQESSGKKRGKGKQKKMTVRVDFTPMVADYFLYALYHPEQASDDGNKHAE